MLLPFIEMLQTIFKERKGHLRLLILIIIWVYSMYWFQLEELIMQYNYLIKAFPGFDGEDMALFSTTLSACSKYSILLSFFSYIKNRPE